MDSTSHNDENEYCPNCNADDIHTYEACIHQIKSWLTECLHNHPNAEPGCCGVIAQCRWPEATPPLPTRVLELDLCDGTEDIRLVSGIGRNGQYAALTYCWGPDPDRIFKTTLGTLQQNQMRIKFTDLNLLFQETVTVLRSLAIPYLWIDALCIIQGSKADWDIEASKMTTVYSNAHLTISALTSTSPDTPLHTQLKHMPGSFRIDRSLQMMIQVGNGKPSTRGWCLQERCLSRRIVHFAKSQMYWECPGATRADHHKVGDRRNLLEPASSLILGPAGFFKDLDGSEHTCVKTDPYRGWYRIMSDYTKRSLSKESDRVPAMLGLIETFNKNTGDRICSGVWKGDVEHGLFWYYDYDESPFGSGEGDSLSEMPSWSWLYTKMGTVLANKPLPGVKWPLQVPRGHITVNRLAFERNWEQNRHPVPLRAISFDEDTSSIVLRGNLFRLQPWMLPHGRYLRLIRDSYELGGTVYWDFDPAAGPHALIRRCRRNKARQPVHGPSDTELEYSVDLLKEISVLFTIEVRRYIDIVGLLLVRTDIPETYRRAGYVELPLYNERRYSSIIALPQRTITLQ